MEGKKDLSVACFETGRYFIGILNEARGVLEDAVELVLETCIDPKDPQPDPDKKARIVVFKTRPAIHSILTIGRDGVRKPSIACMNAIETINLDELSKEVADQISLKYIELWERVSAKLLPPKELGSVITPKKKLIIP